MLTVFIAYQVSVVNGGEGTVENMKSPRGDEYEHPYNLDFHSNWRPFFNTWKFKYWYLLFPWFFTDSDPDEVMKDVYKVKFKR
jgi:hypothetical protein